MDGLYGGPRAPSHGSFVLYAFQKSLLRPWRALAASLKLGGLVNDGLSPFAEIQELGLISRLVELLPDPSS